MAEARRQPGSVDEYIKRFPEDTQRSLKSVRKTVRHTVPAATETISYGIPTFRLNGRYLIYFAAHKNHIGVYPVPSGDRELLKRLSEFVSGRGSIRFPLNKPIPVGLLRRITHALARDNKRKSGKYTRRSS